MEFPKRKINSLWALIKKNELKPRYKRVYAYFPERVGANIVWLSSYWIKEEFNGATWVVTDKFKSFKDNYDKATGV